MASKNFYLIYNLFSEIGDPVGGTFLTPHLTTRYSNVSSMRKSPSQICPSWLREGIKCRPRHKRFAQAPDFVLAQAMRLSIHECATSFLLGSVALFAPCRELLADEGMWLFNAVPAERLQQR
jgi:hypothetical protein